MTVVDRKAAILPPQRRQTIDVPAIGGEVIVQALTLSESLRISMLDGDPKLRIPHILACGVLASDMKPLWTAEEWDVFGSVDDNRLACMELCNGIFGLSHEEKKAFAPELKFAFRLCLALGCTLEELGDRMSLHEFQLWQQFDGESPLPDIRADFHSAQVTNAIVNMSGMSVKEQVPFRNHILFRPQDKPAPRKTDPSELFKKGR